MDIETLTEFFGWMTFINLVLLLLVNAVLIFARDFIYSLVNWAYPISKEAYNIFNISHIQLFKALWGMFNLVPFLALLIIGSK